MSAIIPELKLLYISVPKCACTSLKNCMYFLENKDNFKTYKNNGQYIDIHKLYQSSYFDIYIKKIQKKYDISTFTKICLIRDPIKRFISAYTNRVKHHKELSVKVMKSLDLTNDMADPNFYKFVNNFNIYKKVRSIKHHTDSISKYIGTEPSFYDKIYNIENIDEISVFLKDKYNIDYQIPRLQTGGGGSESIDLNTIKEERPNIYEKLQRITSSDYKIYSEFLN